MRRSLCCSVRTAHVAALVPLRIYKRKRGPERELYAGIGGTLPPPLPHLLIFYDHWYQLVHLFFQFVESDGLTVQDYIVAG